MKRTLFLVGVLGSLLILGIIASSGFSKSLPASPKVFIKYTWLKENHKYTYSVVAVENTVSKIGSAFVICKGSYEDNSFSVTFSPPSRGRDKYIRLSSDFRRAGDYKALSVFDGEIPLPPRGQHERSEITVRGSQPDYWLTITVFVNEEEFSSHVAFSTKQIGRDNPHPNQLSCN